MSLCEDRGIKSSITRSSMLKDHNLDKFCDSIDFFPKGKHIIIHSQFMNPCEYSVATLKGHGMRDSDIISSFANYIKRVVNTKEKRTNFPMKPKELIEEIHRGPTCVLYNTIFMTLHNSGKLNDHGYWNRLFKLS